jgi:F420-0:gamma-glutamyl ligase
MNWIVEYHDEYLAELQMEAESVQDEVFALAELLKMRGPS